MQEKRIALIIDDSIENVQILTQILKEDFMIQSASNGKEAIDCIEQNEKNISVIFLDLIMPTMNGQEFLKKVKCNPKLKSTAILITSVLDDEKTQMDIFNLGAHDFISKPYNPIILKRKIMNNIELLENNNTIEKLKIDEITGAYTKEYFIHMSKEYLNLNLNQEYDLMIINIFNMNNISVVYGTQVSNFVLSYLSKSMSDFGLKVIGRINENHFGIFMEHQSSLDLNFFKPYVNLNKETGESILVKLKYGISQKISHSEDFKQICYKTIYASDSSKNDINYFNDDMEQSLVSEQFLLNDMDRAIKENEFKVYYQPKVSSSTKKICGAEALVRWIHHEKGFMNPGIFINLFERKGNIQDLDSFVWEQVCRDLDSLRKKGIHSVPVSVNVSRSDFYDFNLIDHLDEILNKYHINKEDFHLEITESIYAIDQKAFLQKVSLLKQKGYIIEMDDFGQGYSSLNALAELPIDMLKIDKGFIDDCTTNLKKKVMLEGVMNLAKGLHLPVIAEGVETNEQFEALKKIQCDYIQGYLFSKPIPLVEYLKLLQQNSIIKEKIYS